VTTSFVTLSDSDALPLTLATAKAVLEAIAADEALPDKLDVAALLPATAPCAAIRALDCICEDASLATFAVSALLAFDANRAFTVTVLVANAALLALPAIRLLVVFVTVAKAAEEALPLIWTVATLPRVTKADDLALAASCDVLVLVLDDVSLRSAREDNLAEANTVLAGGNAPKARPKTPNLGPPRKPASGAAIAY
jgi:hypothetical protein